MTGDYAASFLPWILVPTIGLLVPALVMGLLFLYIESDDSEAPRQLPTDQ